MGSGAQEVALAAEKPRPHLHARPPGKDRHSWAHPPLSSEQLLLPGEFREDQEMKTNPPEEMRDSFSQLKHEQINKHQDF